MRRPFEPPTGLPFPALSLGEYHLGIRQSRRCRRYEDWLHRYWPLTEIVAVTQATAGIYADIRQELKHSGNPIPSNDTWIAALARQHAFPVLSNDANFDVVEGIERIAFRGTPWNDAENDPRSGGRT